MPTIIRDTREKIGWKFEIDQFCEGVEDTALLTGDYTLKGYEDILCIERKRNAAEVHTNLFSLDKRFFKELDRMATFKYAFVILEFSMNDLLAFPYGSGIPAKTQRYIKVTGPALLRRLVETQLQYPFIHFIFAGNRGKDYAVSLMKRVIEKEKKNAAKQQPE